MFVNKCFIIFATLMCIAPTGVFATGSDDEGAQAPLACATSHPQFEAQLENTAQPTLRALAQSTPETLVSQTRHLLALPSELLDRILFFACQDRNNPKALEKEWARLRLVCQSFNTAIMQCPEIWKRTNRSLNNIEHVGKFLTCPLKNHLHVTISLRKPSSVDKRVLAIVRALHAALAKNPKQFTVHINNLDPKQRLLELGYKLIVSCTQSDHLQDLLEKRPSRLQILNASHLNFLGTLNVSQLPMLHTLKLASVSCKTLNISQLPMLHTLVIEDNPRLLTLTLKELPMLHTLCISGSGIMETLTLSELPMLHTLDIEESDYIKTLHARQLPMLHTIKFSWANCETFNLSQLPMLHTLTLHNCLSKNAKTLNLSELPMLHTLNVNKADNIQTINADACPKIPQETIDALHTWSQENGAA